MHDNDANGEGLKLNKSFKQKGRFNVNADCVEKGRSGLKVTVAKKFRRKRRVVKFGHRMSLVKGYPL